MGVRSADTMTASGIERASMLQAQPIPGGAENAILFYTEYHSQDWETWMQLSGSSAVVVGGTGGMGEATVPRLPPADVRGVVADVNDDKGKAPGDELGVRYLHTDAGSEEDVTAAFTA